MSPRLAPMTRLFGAFVVLGLGVLGLLLVLLAANGLNSAFERQLNRLMEARVESHTQLLLRYVNNHLLVLKDIAEAPVVIQGVMQPETGLPNAIEFLETVNIVGLKPRFTLFDSKGQLLYDSARHETCLPEQEELRSLLLQQKTSTTRFHNACKHAPARSEPFLRLVTPVLWRDKPEGLLAAEIPVSQVGVLYRINKSSPLESLSLLLGDAPIFVPKNPVQGLQERRTIPEFGVTLLFSMDLSGVDKERNALLAALALTVLALIVIFGALAFFIGRRLFVLPLTEIRQRADLVRQGKMPPPLKRATRVLEISTLDDALQDMAREVLTKQKQLQEQIFEREQVAKALRESEKLLEATGKTAKVGGWQLDMEAMSLTWTAETYAIHELDPDQSPSVSNALDFYAPESRRQLMHALERLQEHNEPYDLELAFITARGRQIWVRTKGERAWDPQRPGLLTGIIQDITERKTAELALRESEEFNKRIIESSPDCIKVLDAAARLRYMSPGGQKLMCIEDLTPFLDTYYPTLLPEESRHEAETALANARKGHTATFQAYMPDLACTPHWWSISVTPLLGADGELQRFLVVSRDVSSLKQAEEEQRLAKETAIAANKAKSEFLANMSHEIRTPMNGILGMAQLMASTRLNEEQQESLETIETSARALLQLINDILDLSKIEAEKMELVTEPFRLDSLVREVVDSLSPQAAAKGLRLSWSLTPGVPAILLGDPIRLRQVLLNLVGNALKFTEVGSVRLEVSCAPGSSKRPETQDVYEHDLLFAVTDTGIGIPPESQEMIFESFSQVDGSVTRSYGGTGLGLSISRKLVQLMGGSMHLQSATGQGSTFSFSARFQVDPELELPHEQSGSEDSFTAWGLLILVVDDNQINRLVARRMLERTGNTVHLAASGPEALELLQVNNYALVFMDVQMPGMDGLQATAQIRQAQGLRSPNDIHVVAMTAHAMKGDRERFLAAGMNDYLPKPLSMENLQTALRRYVDKSMGKPGEFHETRPASLLRSVLEREQAIHRFAGDEELYAEACNDFLKNSPLKLEAIEAALNNEDCSEAVLHAHSLKGNSSTIGAMLCASVAGELESACRNQALDRAWRLLHSLRERFEEAAGLLR